jgi:hypothetical protein
VELTVMREKGIGEVEEKGEVDDDEGMRNGEVKK